MDFSFFNTFGYIHPKGCFSFQLPPQKAGPPPQSDPVGLPVSLDLALVWLPVVLKMKSALKGRGSLLRTCENCSRSRATAWLMRHGKASAVPGLPRQKVQALVSDARGKAPVSLCVLAPCGGPSLFDGGSLGLRNGM